MAMCEARGFAELGAQLVDVREVDVRLLDDEAVELDPRDGDVREVVVAAHHRVGERLRGERRELFGHVAELDPVGVAGFGLG